MKKIVTFSNFMVFLGILTILFYLIPAITITPNTEAGDTSINLFVATFGGSFTIDKLPSLGAQSLIPCAGLIVGFVLGIVAIVLTFLKVKNKYATLLACPFYIAAGVLAALAASLVTTTNANAAIANIFTYKMAAGAITVAVFWCILSFLALVDFIAAVAKPKPQNPAY